MSDFKEMRRNKEFDKIIGIYNSEMNVESADKWDTWNFIYALKVSEKNFEAEEISLKLFELHPEFEYNKNILSWILFENHVKKFKNSDKALEATVFILKNITQCKESSYTNAVWEMTEHFKINKNFDKAVEWLKKIDVELLSSDSRKYYVESDEKVYYYYSEKEHWYSTMSKLLFDLENYEECIAICSESLKNISEFHHDNDIWINFRLLYSKAFLYEDAELIKELEDLSERKNHFILYFYIFRLKSKLGLTADAIDSGCKACLSISPDKMKIKVYYELGIFLYDHLDKNIGSKHILLCKLIREKEGWIVPSNYSVYTEDLTTKNYKELKTELIEFWNIRLKRELNFFEGEIVKIFVDKGFGFIKCEEGNVYFSTKQFTSGASNKLQQGSKIRFNIVDAYDKKKKQNSVRAINIQFVEEEINE